MGQWDSGCRHAKEPPHQSPVLVLHPHLRCLVHAGDEERPCKSLPKQGARFTKICNVQAQIIFSAVDFGTIRWSKQTQRQLIVNYNTAMFWDLCANHFCETSHSIHRKCRRKTTGKKKTLWHMLHSFCLFKAELFSAMWNILNCFALF